MFKSVSPEEAIMVVDVFVVVGVLNAIVRLTYIVIVIAAEEFHVEEVCLVS